MKKYILLISILTFTGCGTIEKYNSLPSSERYGFLKAEATSFLEGNKGLIKQSLIFAGLEIMDRTTSQEERKSISDQMYATSVAFNSLATGKVITTDQIEATLKSFSPDSDSTGYNQYISEATAIWSGIFGKLEISDNQKLVIDYLILFSEAAQEVAATYK